MRYVGIKDKKESTYQHREELRNIGLEWNDKTKMWHGEADDSIDYEGMFKKLDVFYYDKSHMRGHHYRRDFLRRNGLKINGKKYYHCAYCGKPLMENEVAVDHIMPVNGVYGSQNRKMNRWIMKKLGLKYIDDNRNLCAACNTCNARKGKKIGFWLLRGYIGRHYTFWLAMYALFITLYCMTFILFLR